MDFNHRFQIRPAEYRGREAQDQMHLLTPWYLLQSFPFASLNYPLGLALLSQSCDFKDAIVSFQLPPLPCAYHLHHFAKDWHRTASYTERGFNVQIAFSELAFNCNSHCNVNDLHRILSVSEKEKQHNVDRCRHCHEHFTSPSFTRPSPLNHSYPHFTAEDSEV